MDDLLDNFANIDSPNMESTSEEGYIYHFVDESPAPLEHNRPVHPTTIAGEPNNHTSFFNIESPPPYQSTGGENEDEGDYNADIDDDDDDDVFGPGTHKASQFRAYRENPTIDAGDRRESGGVKPSPAISDDEQDLKQHLRKLHRQDLERDELIAVRPLPSPLDPGAC